MRHRIFCLMCATWMALSSWCAAEPTAALRSAQPGYSWNFPADHGAHRGFETEWWYFTGQLFSAEAVPFRDVPLYGFQLTFFRRSKVVNGAVSSELLAHAALTDVQSKKTLVATRQGGALLGIAGAAESGLDVWSGDWMAAEQGGRLLMRFDLPGNEKPLRVELRVEDPGAPWLQGEKGYSRKGECASCASHYYSLPRLKVSGDITLSERTVPVHGVGWMDHEFMTNTLDVNQVGWDWMGLMFSDGRELMVFRLRDSKGLTSYMSGSLRAGGKELQLRADEFSLEPVGDTVREVDGGRYPLSWRVRAPKYSIDVLVSARVPQCGIGNRGKELTPRYWEGPVASADESVLGYLEMTGYTGRVTM